MCATGDLLHMSICSPSKAVHFNSLHHISLKVYHQTQSVNLSHGPSREEKKKKSRGRFWISMETHQSKATQDASVKRQMGKVRNVKRGQKIFLKPRKQRLSVFLSLCLLSHTVMQMSRRKRTRHICMHGYLKRIFEWILPESWSSHRSRPTFFFFFGFV